MRCLGSKRFSFLVKIPVVVSILLTMFFSAGESFADASVDDITKDANNYVGICQKNYYYSSLHDCRCVANHLRSWYLKHPSHVPSGEDFGGALMHIQKEVDISCVAPREQVYKYYYRSCSNMFKASRPDWQSFCECTTSNIVDNYIRNPRSDQGYTQSLQVKALVSCRISHKVKPVTSTAPLTAVQIADVSKAAEKYVADCNTNSYFSTYHDCRCVANHLRDWYLKSNTPTSPDSSFDVKLSHVLNDVDAHCIASRDVIYEGNFKQCERAFGALRSDSKSFCGCVANGIAKKALQHAPRSVREQETWKSQAMMSCGLGR